MNPSKLTDCEKTARDFCYILFVKASTLPVYVNSTNNRLEPDGSLLMRFLNVVAVDSLRLNDTMFRYPCLGKLEYNGSSDEISKKTLKKMISACQRRSCLPHSFEFIELIVQVDVFCTIEENTAIKEIEYVKHNLQETYDSFFQTDACRFVAYQTQYDRDHTGQNSMVEEGYQRIAFDSHFLIGIAKN